MTKLQEKAQELENALRESPEFKEFEATFNAMIEDEEARGLYEGFRDFQISLNEKQSQGIEVTEAEVEEGRVQFETLKENQIVNNFMSNEHQLNQIIHEVSTIIMKPLEDAYEASMTK